MKHVGCVARRRGGAGGGPGHMPNHLCRGHASLVASTRVKHSPPANTIYSSFFTALLIVITISFHTHSSHQKFPPLTFNSHKKYAHLLPEWRPPGIKSTNLCNINREFQIEPWKLSILTFFLLADGILLMDICNFEQFLFVLKLITCKRIWRM